MIIQTTTTINNNNKSERKKERKDKKKASNAQYHCSPPTDWCPGRPQAVTGPFEPSLYKGHDILWNRIFLWPVHASCPNIAWKWKSPRLGYALLPNKQNICGLSTFSYWIQNTACTSYMKIVLQASKKKINFIPVETRTDVCNPGTLKALFCKWGSMHMCTCRRLERYQHVVLMASYSLDSSVKFWCVYFEEMLTALS